MIFVPVLKTKRSSEIKALELAKSFWEHNENIVPYIEMIKHYSHSDAKKYIKLLSEKEIFVEPHQYDEASISSILCDHETAIISINCNRVDKPMSLISFIHGRNRKIALRIESGKERQLEICKELNNDDYIIVDLTGNDFYSSLFFIELVKRTKSDNKIIVLSNERSIYLTGKKFADLKFNNQSNFNVSVIDSIKNGDFEYDGFASYCSAKNDSTEGVAHGGSDNVYGYQLFYDYDKNNFYSVRSDNQNYVGVIYNEVKDKLIRNYSTIEEDVLCKTPETKKILDNYLKEAKYSCNKSITVSIVRYIEEIDKHLFN